MGSGVSGEIRVGGFYFVENENGWRIRVRTLRPSLMPGVKRHFLMALRAGPSKEELLDCSIRGSTTLP